MRAPTRGEVLAWFVKRGKAKVGATGKSCPLKSFLSAKYPDAPHIGVSLSGFEIGGEMVGCPEWAAAFIRRADRQPWAQITGIMAAAMLKRTRIEKAKP